ncbi:MarR family winged helix-turn-helix transcriptional regulator [Actinospica robiniae]|uniref:MarR family winged helix-turn-helix transcriptional regulator n=1 Tax=Actinospica robiniae TaxID=304901 RepID=UPI000423324A|nr:MarR family transcriptional regulator [Actinospica robiniae]
MDDEEKAAAWRALRAYVKAQDRARELRETVGIGRGSGRVTTLTLLEQSPRTPAELARLLDVDRSHVTVILNTLEERGYITRDVHPEDRRRKDITLTQAGRDVVRRVHDVIDRPPGGFDRLTPQELTTLHGLIGKLTTESEG